MPYLESISALMARKPTLIKDPAKFKFEDHLRAFALAGVGSIDTIIDFQNALEKAIANKQTLYDFIKANPRIAQSFSKKRLERIFSYNKVYSHTRAKMLGYENTPPMAESEDGDGWYYLFESELDSAARHKAYHGVCLPRKHEFWQTHTPPLDWGCRCRLSMHSKEGLKRYNALNGTHYQISHTPPPSVRSKDKKNAFEGDVYKFLHNFFNAKLQKYAQNKEAIARLANVVRVCEAKKMRLKKLIELSKSPEQIIDFATLKPEIMQVVGAHSPLVRLSARTLTTHLEKHPETDLFDYYLAQDILQEPMAIFKDKEGSSAPGALNNYLIGVKFGRWYRLSIGVEQGENRFRSLVHGSKVRLIKKLMGAKQLIYKSKDFTLE